MKYPVLLLLILGTLMMETSAAIRGCYCNAEYEPVCGVDGKTYINSCEAFCVEVDTAYKGECHAKRELAMPEIIGRYKKVK